MSDDTLYNYRRPISLWDETVTLLDVMQMVRQYPNLSPFDHFGRVVNKVLWAGLAVSSSCKALHVICDNYIDESLKMGERVRRASNIASGELFIPDESTMQIEKIVGIIGKEALIVATDSKYNGCLPSFCTGCVEWHGCKPIACSSSPPQRRANQSQLCFQNLHDSWKTQMKGLCLMPSRQSNVATNAQSLCHLTNTVMRLLHFIHTLV